MKQLILISIILVSVFVWHWAKIYSNNYTYAEENKEPTTSDIKYDPAYKDRVYGNTFRGLAMSIESTQKKYEVGEKIDISILFRNFGKEKVGLSHITGEPIKNYRFCLFYQDGQPVHKSKHAEELEISVIGKKSTVIYSVRSIYIYPGIETGSITVRLHPYFNIEKEGTYFLVMMRRMTESWEDGFLISNMTKINIVNPKEKKIEQGALKSE